MHIDKVQHTWHLIARLHQGQHYGGQQKDEHLPYIHHIGSVVFEMLEALRHDATLDAELGIACAMLHDTLEDTTFKYTAIEQLFGASVADGVLALTKNTAISDKKARMADSLDRIQRQPPTVWAVKMADRICNLYAPPWHWSNEKKETYISEAEMILAALGAACPYLGERLKSKIEVYRLNLRPD